MSASGKTIRLSRFKRRGGAAGLLIPIDHGLTMGPLEGIKNLGQLASWITHPAITGIIAHKGMIERLGERGLLAGVGVMVHLNGMASFGGEPDTKTMVTSVRAAQRLGADGVSVQVNFDGNNDSHNLQLLGRVTDAARAEGLPVLTMLYDKVKHDGDVLRLRRLRHLVRLAIELGTDALKLAPPAAARLGWELPQLVSDHGRDTAIYFAGGSECEDAELLRLARESVSWGGSGLCVGRNVFGREEPGKILAELDRALTQPEAVAVSARRVPEGGKLGVH